MTQCRELGVQRDNLRQTRIESRDVPPLGEGQVRVAIDLFGLFITSFVLYDYLQDNKVSAPTGQMVSLLS